jgi:ketosteroid isomerase-like protein
MSQESVEVVQRLFEALARADYDAAASLLHPDAEWHNTAGFPGPVTVRGRAAIRRFWQDLAATYSSPTPGRAAMEIEKVAHAGGVVAILVHGRGYGRQSRIPLDTTWAHSFRLQDAKVLRAEAHGSYEKALKAAGLRE